MKNSMHKATKIRFNLKFDTIYFRLQLLRHWKIVNGRRKKCACREINPGPLVYESGPLTFEQMVRQTSNVM